MIDIPGVNDYWDMALMLQRFARASAQPYHRRDSYHTQHLARRIQSIHQSGGILLIARHQADPSGMIISARHPDTWLPDVWIQSELAWWVEPDHRGGTTGYRLLKEYTRIADQQLASGFVQDIHLTTLMSSPVRDLESRGWTPVETHWSRIKEK